MSDLERVARVDQSVDSLPPAPETQANYLPSPIVPPTPRSPERTSNRVTVGYFDRAGVDQLRRTLTHLSETWDPENARGLSSETLSIPATGPFDFERTLRTIMKKYAISLMASSFVNLVWHVDAIVQAFNRASSASCLKIFTLSAWVPPPVFSQLLAQCSTRRSSSRIFRRCATLPCAIF